MDNRRQYERFSVDILEINGKMMFAKEVKILDISLGGVSLKADKRLNLGNEYTLKIEGKGKTLSIKGVVVWSWLSESREDDRGNLIPIYTAGMKFTDISDESLRAVGDFLDENRLDTDRDIDKFSPNGLRLYVRISIEEPQKAILNIDGSYKVRKISLGGMLVESEHLLEIETKIPMEITLAEDRSIKVFGRIASCLLSQDEENEHYEIGVEFLDMSDKDRTTLQEFIGLLNSMDKSSTTLQ
jgi:hypothetical protein